MKRLGILGTFVWDTIWTLEDQAAGRPFETWGGMAYSLAAGAAALPAGWEIVPFAKIGADLFDAANRYLDGLGIADRSALVSVPIPNNRVELRYTDVANRGEKMTGGVPGWTWEELVPHLETVDAIALNFFSGFELGLETSECVGASFPGPVYADLHSLFLGPPCDGARPMRRLPEWERWLAAFPTIQLNEDELRMLGESAGRPLTVAGLLDLGPKTAFVTLGGEGAEYATRATDGSVATARVAPPVVPSIGDPTGCGDAWGITAFESLLAGASVPEAVAAANRLAATAYGCRGASGLYDHLVARREAWGPTGNG
ncbi:MAG TPA: carbohydrate kinase family protein [Longimicrobium sp.]|nr:carbohydrate kinase family protein [Longimicrobium sp.]